MRAPKGRERSGSAEDAAGVVLGARLPRLSRLVPCAVTVVLIALVLGVGCGGDDGTTTTASGPSEQAGESSADNGADDADAGASGGGSGSGAVSEEFTDPLGGEAPPPVEKLDVPSVPKGSDDSIQTFGEEAGAEQSAEAAQVVKGFFQGRVDRKWANACYYLSAETVKALEQAVNEGAGCVTVLRNLGRNVPRKVLQREAKVRVGSVRVEGNRGFVVYKGVGGEWFAVPLSKEDGEWKLGALAGLPIY